MRAIPVAHQFLAKPYELRDLVLVVERALELRRMLTNPAVRTVIGTMSSLPAMPYVLQKLCRVIEDPDTRIADVVSVIEVDPAIAARVLHVVNSAFFAPPRKIADIADAIRYLGTALLKNLVLAIEVFTLLDGAQLASSYSAVTEQQHSIRCGMLASVILRDVNPGAAYTAGLLHDVGRLILATKLPGELEAIAEQAAREQRSPLEVERERLGVTHAEIGAYLLGIWGLTHDVVHAVALHHTPASIVNMDAAAAVHIADGLLCEETSGRSGNLDATTLERLGLMGRLEEWKAAARDLRSR
jgi:HD-like signal output (HDOD) protein